MLTASEIPFFFFAFKVQNFKQRCYTKFPVYGEIHAYLLLTIFFLFFFSFQLFITSGAFAIFVACLVLAFVLHLDVTGRVMLVFYALGAVAFGVTGYNIIRLAC